MFQSSATGPIVVFKRMRVCMEFYPIGHDSRSPCIRAPGPGISQGSATDTSMIRCPWRAKAATNGGRLARLLRCSKRLPPPLLGYGHVSTGTYLTRKATLENPAVALVRG